MQTIHKAAFANAVALTLGAFYVLCSLLSVVYPDWYVSVAGALFHWQKHESIGYQMTFSSLLLGLVYLLVGSWLIGYFWALVYNKLSGRRRGDQ